MVHSLFARMPVNQSHSLTCVLELLQNTKHTRWIWDKKFTAARCGLFIVIINVGFDFAQPISFLVLNAYNWVHDFFYATVKCTALCRFAFVSFRLRIGYKQCQRNCHSTARLHHTKITFNGKRFLLLFLSLVRGATKNYFFFSTVWQNEIQI